MFTLYKMEQGVVMRLNNGPDHVENVYISLYDYLIDTWNGCAVMNPRTCRSMFETILLEIIEEEIKPLPKDLRNSALQVMESVVNFIKNVKL